MIDTSGSMAHDIPVGSPVERETALGRDAKALLLLVGVATLVTGTALLLVPDVAGVGEIDQASQRPSGTQLWPWSLRTPLNSRFFGAFFFSVGVGALLALRERTWERIRILFPVAIVFTGLGALIALAHLASFNPARPATWLFFALYFGALLGEIAIFITYNQRSHKASTVRRASAKLG